MKVKKKLANLLLLVFFLVSASAVFTLVHEQRHVSIAENMGCSAEVEILPKPGALAATYTDCSGANLSEREQLHLRTRQENVETTGYQLQILLYLVVFIAYNQVKNPYESL